MKGRHSFAVFVWTWRIFLALSPTLALTTLCEASHISGTYVGHGRTFTEMLQLTESADGKISGVLNSVTLKAEGTVSADQISVTGVMDAEQITLNLHSFLSSSTLAGTVKGNTIELQSVDSRGNVGSSMFVRSTVAEFKQYADELKVRGDGIVFSRKLVNDAQELRQTVRSAENWISNAEMHAGRVPKVKAAYDNIEHQMQLLIDQERRIADGVARSQISVKVDQGDVAGEQRDIQVNQVWDLAIGEPGMSLERTFSNWDGNCGTPEELRKRGASPESVDSWVTACKEAVDERAKFGPVFRRIMDQRRELKSYQAAAQAHRKAMVNEANRIQ